MENEKYNSPGKVLPWVADKVKLIELGAGLSETKVFGKDTTRQQIWAFLETVTGCKLSRAESALNQIKNRKKNQTQFIDEMKSAITNLLEHDYK